MQSRVNAFAQHVRSVFFTKLDHSGFADCLTATLLMYLDDTLAVLHDHIVHSQLLKVAMLHGADVDELKRWGRRIRNRFVLDNLQSLPVETIQKNLDDRERAAQHVAVHTFAETLERCVVGYSELTREVHELKAMVQVLIDSSRSQNDALARTVAHVAHSRVPSQEPDMLALGRQWPDDFSSLRDMKLQDLVVRYVRDDMATVAMDTNIRLHKEVMHAMAIVVQFADLSSIPPVPATISDSAVATYMNTLSAFARDVQLRVVAFIEQRRQLLQTGKRKRSINGSVSGVVKAWGKLPEIDRTTMPRTTRICFPSLGST